MSTLEYLDPNIETLVSADKMIHTDCWAGKINTAQKMKFSIKNFFSKFD